jgi:hypothetical protein
MEEAMALALKVWVQAPCRVGAPLILKSSREMLRWEEMEDTSTMLRWEEMEDTSGRTSDSEEFKGDAAMGGNGGHQHWRLMTGGVMSSRNHQGQDLLIRCRGMLRCTQVL